MFDLVLTALLLLMLAGCTLYQAKLHPNGNPFFFNAENTNAMRGFWCIIVILVHIPVLYQNFLQDAVGSFGYIGVTFFFLVSAYGLSLGVKRDPASIHFFWRKRLPKLLIPNFLVNLFDALMCTLLLGRGLRIENCFVINGWVWWLLFCYLVFWLAIRLCSNSYTRVTVLSFAIILFSLSMYWLNKREIIIDTVWPTEVYGFIWGVLLALCASRFTSLNKHQWYKYCGLVFLSAMVAGVLYLKYKPTVFWGEYLLKILLGVIITVFVLLLNSRISISNKAISFLGNISYEVYLVHGSVITILAILCPGMTSGVFILLAVFLSVALAYFLHGCSSVLLKQLQRIKWFQTK